MIPLTLNVRNFMSYTDVHEPLRFDGIHVAVLTGDNGHGKSALLDAITWALWGRARARAVDELIHAGASEMEVEFEFELDGDTYRVIRKRQRRGKSGYSDLQFAVLAEGGYKPLTERSVVETERLIERTLRMSYDTFTNSSFIQQGRADSFTINSPADRKRILAEVLELGYYDELEGRAKERFKTREAELLDERRLAQDWQAEIGRRPEYQSELDRLRTERRLRASVWLSSSRANSRSKKPRRDCSGSRSTARGSAVRCASGSHCASRRSPCWRAQPRSRRPRPSLTPSSVSSSLRCTNSRCICR